MSEKKTKPWEWEHTAWLCPHRDRRLIPAVMADVQEKHDLGDDEHARETARRWFDGMFPLSEVSLDVRNEALKLGLAAYQISRDRERAELRPTIEGEGW